MGNEKMFDEIIKGICSRLPSVVSVILYGSVARGEHGPESDVDIALLVKSPLTNDELYKLMDFISSVNLKYNQFISPIDIEEDKYNTYKEVLPFYKTISEEGIVLWKAA